MQPLLAAIDAYEWLARHALQELGCEAYSVRELTGVSGFDGTEVRYYRSALNVDGEIDCLHGSEEWYDDVLGALLPLISPATGESEGRVSFYDQSSPSSKLTPGHQRQQQNREDAPL